MCLLGCIGSQARHVNSSFGIWGLAPRPGIKPGSPILGARSLSHWTIREVLAWLCLIALGSASGWDGKESTSKAGDPGFIPGLGHFPGEGNGNPVQYSWLENPTDREAWLTIESTGWQRVGHNWATNIFNFIYKNQLCPCVWVSLKWMSLYRSKPSYKHHSGRLFSEL